MHVQMAVELRSPSKSGKFPSAPYSFQVGALATRDAEIWDKIQATKEELHEVLNQLDEFDRSEEQINLQEMSKNTQGSRRRDLQEVEEDDDMADLSPETRALMERVMNKREYQRIDTDRMGDLKEDSNKKKQLKHMLSVVKQGIDSR
jgi:hypothetical protein